MPKLNFQFKRIVSLFKHKFNLVFNIEVPVGKTEMKKAIEQIKKL